MVKTVKSGDEYKILKQKSKAKKIALVFSILWLCFIGFIATKFYKNSNNIRNYAVVYGVSIATNTLMDQYNGLSDNVVKNLNISKYTQKIEIPEIKLDSISDKAEKVSKLSAVASKFGVKGANKVADTSATLQKQVDKINKDIKSKTAEVSKKLEQDITKSLKNEIDSFGIKQMKKILNLSDTNYKYLTENKYGFTTEGQRKISTSIYNELSKNNHSVIKNIFNILNKYWNWITYGVLAIIIIIGFIPVYLVFKVAKSLSNNFTKCPYCGKVFLSKTAKFNILAKFKFW